MLNFKRSRLLMLFLAWMVLESAAFCGTPITVTDQKGRSLDIELISVAGDNVTFSRKGDPKEFTLPISNFAEISQNLIRKQAALMPAAVPKIRPDVVIGKRRSKNDSYYMVRQEISSTVKLINTDTKVPVPPFTGRIVYLGQNQRRPDLLIVLSAQDFEGSIEASKTFVKEMETFVTSYDSDNKGYGNIGGFQYFGYLLVVRDQDEKIILDYTVSGPIRQAIKENQSVLKEMFDYRKYQNLDLKLQPAKDSSTFRVPR